MTFLLLIVGLGLLIVGAEILVRGASKVAAGVGISPLVIGLTIVAFGTSSPEFAVSIWSNLSGSGSIAVGNVVGSNIFNVLFILGLSAILAPLVVNQKLVRLDVPLMIGVSILAFVMALDGIINRLDGFLLFAGLIAYTVFLIWESRQETQEIRDEYAKEFSGDKKPSARDWLFNSGLIVGGLAMLVVGSDWLVESAVEIALQVGVSSTVMGLTLIAAGTSLPEVATSVVASLRNERDIAVGNVIGSSIFNTLGVLGLTGLVSPTGLSIEQSILFFDMLVMIAVALACLPIFFVGFKIERWQGVLFFAYYLIYTSYLVLRATEHNALTSYNMIILQLILPLTIILIIVLVVKASLKSVNTSENDPSLQK